MKGRKKRELRKGGVILRGSGREGEKGKRERANDVRGLQGREAGT